MKQTKRTPSLRASLKGISIAATTVRVLELLSGLDWNVARVADVGAGRGHFSHALGEALRQEHGLEPADHVSACDLDPSVFHYAAIECVRAEPNGRLPFAEASFDAVVSIEVIEHVEDQFAFLRELTRICKPGGLVLVTTPNVSNLNSRVRGLVWGFPSLFGPLDVENPDPRFLGGHIHPISPYFLAYGALRVGLEAPRFHTDRTKRSAVFWALLLSPAVLVAKAAQYARLRRKAPELLRQNRALLDAQSGWRLLTGRTTILTARKPDTGLIRNQVHPPTPDAAFRGVRGWGMNLVPYQLLLVGLLVGCTNGSREEACAERYPDVLGARAELAADGTWTVWVTVSSPHDTPERYADGWRVVGPDGTQYGFRLLRHDHAHEQPFTRSLGGIEIPAGVDVVTVEGRDRIEGWGGATFELALER